MGATTERFDASEVAEMRSMRERIAVLREEIQNLEESKRELSKDLVEVTTSEEKLQTQMEAIKRLQDLALVALQYRGEPDPVVVALLESIRQFAEVKS